MSKTKEEIFDNQIAPLLEQIQEICKKSDIGSVMAFQIKLDKQDGAMISLSGNKSSDIIQPFDIAAQILSGNVSVMAVPAEQALELGLTDGVMTLIKQHADECDDCRMKIQAAELSGKTLSLEDFQHQGASALDSLGATVAVTETPTVAKPKKEVKIKGSTMFSELMQQGGFGAR